MIVLLIAFINFFSAFVQASSGFGYAIFSMFLMPIFLPFNQCSVISASVIVAIALQMTITLHKYISIKKMAVPMFSCLLFIKLGIELVDHLSESILRKIMGIFLLCLSGYFYYTQKHKKIIRVSRKDGILIGVLTGITTGMFNIVGPVLALYYIDNCKNHLEFKANLECSFLLAGLVSLGMNVYGIHITWELTTYVITSCLASVIAGMIGLKIFHKLNKEKVKYIILCILPFMGIIQLIK